MGTPVKEIVYGDNCLFWEPIDRTPQKIYALFWDILKGDQAGAFEPPNSHIFTLHQVDALPCLWRTETAAFSWRAEVGIDATQTWIDLIDLVHANAHYFGRTLDISPPPEYTSFTNVHNNPWGKWGYDGFAVIFWLEKVLEIVEEFGWSFLADLMLETFPIDAVDYVIKFCSLELRLNLKMRFTP